MDEITAWKKASSLTHSGYHSNRGPGLVTEFAVTTVTSDSLAPGPTGLQMIRAVMDEEADICVFKIIFRAIRSYSLRPWRPQKSWNWILNGLLALARALALAFATQP